MLSPPGRKRIFHTKKFPTLPISLRIRTGRSVKGLPFNPNMTEAQYKCVNIRWKNMSLEVDIQISKYQLKQYESRNWITKSQGAWGTCNQCLWQAAAVSRRHLNQSPLSPVPSCCSNIDQHPTQTINEPDCAGTYYPLTGMSDDVQQQLIDDHFLFKEGDRFLQVSESDLKQSSIRCMSTGSKRKQILANRPRHFPQRGEDVPSLGWWRGPPSHHLHGARWRCWSCVPAADRRDRTHGSTSNCQANICMCLFLQDSLMSFTSDERLGWLTFCPTNLGTAIRFALWNGQSRDIFLI